MRTFEGESEVMAEVMLGSDAGNLMTAVPNVFIDEYMADAQGEYVKIYLYLLRCMTGKKETISISRMADTFDLTEKAVKRALRYWEKAHLLRLEFEDEQLTGICLVEQTAARSAEKKKSDKVSLRKEKKIDEAPTKTAYSSDEIDSFGRQESIKELLYAAESLVGRSLTRTDLNAMLSWYDELSFSPELIIYLVEYCCESGHKSLHYMNKVALSWKESGVETEKQAKELVRQRSRIYHKVVKAFGITGRALAESELAFLDKWKKTYRFSDDMIQEACRRTMTAIQSPSFEYTDAILKSWKEKKIETVEEAEKADAVRKKMSEVTQKTPKTSEKTNKFNNFEQRTYNYEELEAQLLKAQKETLV